MNVSAVQNSTIDRIYQNSNTVKVESDQTTKNEEVSDSYSESDSLSKFKKLLLSTMYEICRKMK